MELPQTLNSGCYDCFQRDVLLFAQPNRKIISSSLVALPRFEGERGCVFSGKDLGGTDTRFAAVCSTDVS